MFTFSCIQCLDARDGTPWEHLIQWDCSPGWPRQVRPVLGGGYSFVIGVLDHYSMCINMYVTSCFWTARARPATYIHTHRSAEHACHVGHVNICRCIAISPVNARRSIRLIDQMEGLHIAPASLGVCYLHLAFCRSGTFS
jgi:hypothetical protein